jgi:hypothetical protein
LDVLIKQHPRNKYPLRETQKLVERLLHLRQVQIEAVPGIGSISPPPCAIAPQSELDSKAQNKWILNPRSQLLPREGELRHLSNNSAFPGKVK